jgi:hypothetical protein
VPRIDTAETLAFKDCPANDVDAATPSSAPGSWFIVGPSGAGRLEYAEADDAVECVFLGQTIVVSGRSGHNQRLNGVFKELAEDYGSFPAYFDEQKHMFIYRRLDRDSWVISNRLGPARQSGRGILFAEVEDDASQPYSVTRPWTVTAWGPRPAEVDPNISVFLRPDSGRDAPAPQVLTVRSQIRPELAGVFTLLESKQVNDNVVYSRICDSRQGLEAFIFWDGERWCVDSSLPATSSGKSSSQNNAVRSQRRQIAGRNHPDDAVWLGVEVLRGGGCERIDASLLSSLRGRRAEISKQFA